MQLCITTADCNTVRSVKTDCGCKNTAIRVTVFSQHIRGNLKIHLNTDSVLYNNKNVALYSLGLYVVYDLGNEESTHVAAIFHCGPSCHPH